ncbi:MAG TPA: DUF6600 domain-containing protein [Spirochaetia bacterium]|nr:DUF6600 domain-containing protein [Spirochaetia bacterium]
MKSVLLSALGVAALAAFVWADPPARVGRLSDIDGNVSFAAAVGSAWQKAVVNYPLTEGNQLSTADGARAEIQIGSDTVRLDSDTLATFEALDDQTVQLRLDKGRASVTLQRLGPSQTFQIVTQTASISLSAPGRYRVDQAESGASTIITRRGQAQVTGGQTAFQVGPGQAADIPASGADGYQISSAPALDSWDQWVAERDSRENASVSTRYVSSEMDGAEDLDQYGRWEVVAGYGPVWFPTVAAGWVPYTFGSWVWVNPWGWTWVDNEPWGFAPFHYGRWALITGTWCWVPGPIVARPVFAPALVRWVGGRPWWGHPPDRVSIARAPLGPREVFHPLYHASTTYYRAVNGIAVARRPHTPPWFAPHAAFAPRPSYASSPLWAPGHRIYRPPSAYGPRPAYGGNAQVIRTPGRRIWPDGQLPLLWQDRRERH